jgi:thioredoxin 1
MSVEHKTLEITDANFEELVLKSDKPVIVDYWATWCGPCKMLSPIVEELAKEMDGQVVFGKMNVEKNITGTKYGVSALPTLMFFKGGQKVESIMGVPTKAKLKEKAQAMV